MSPHSPAQQTAPSPAATRPASTPSHARGLRNQLRELSSPAESSQPAMKWKICFSNVSAHPQNNFAGHMPRLDTLVRFGGIFQIEGSTNHHSDYAVFNRPIELGAFTGALDGVISEYFD